MKMKEIKVGAHYWVEGGIWKCLSIHLSVPRSPRMLCVWPNAGQEKLFDARQVEREATERELANMREYS